MAGRGRAEVQRDYSGGGVGGEVGLGSLLGLSASDGGSYFAARGADFVVLVAAQGSTVACGYVAIGRTH